jgi:SAM-dependent methyltransferase
VAELDKAARCGEPSYIWRAGQQRRLELIRRWAGERLNRQVLENGCGVGLYVERLAPLCGLVVGLEFDYPRAHQAAQTGQPITNAAGERLPFSADTFALILSHEVLEHVQDDREALCEMVRVLEPGGRLVLFTPNRGYPFETHGIYWRGNYRFGNIPLVNYLPRAWRDRLAPHVRVYSRQDLERLFSGLPVRLVERTLLFGAYDNIIARWPRLGRTLRAVLQWLERTPLRNLGLSHFWVVEKLPEKDRK